jgi:hypothetical protein
MCLGLLYEDSAKLLMTLPNTWRDLLMLQPYLSRSPLICFVRYEPAKSMK